MPSYIITGAPGTGKSALLAELGQDFGTVAEPARELIAEFRAEHADVPGAPEFVALMLQRSIEKFTLSATSDPVPVFFDRGMPDCVAYATHLGVDARAAEEASRRYRYEPVAYLAPVWEEIYTNDEERQMTIAQVRNFDRCVVDAYRRARYQLVELPRATIAERAAFIRGRLGS